MPITNISLPRVRPRGPLLGAILLGLAAQSAWDVTLSPAWGAPLVPQQVVLTGGKRFNLQLGEGFRIQPAISGLKRIRFFAQSPDGRVFLTDMHDLSDNRKGKIYILERFDPATGRFASARTYLANLRNPNSIVFHTDRGGTHWLYLALTDRLVRYRYTPGENTPGAAPEVLATFPDYGLSYKYGGWHLTRTVTVGPDERVYVSVGSSCNACIEKEAVRATVMSMDLDGKNARPYARGLRNSVGLAWLGSDLYATNMGADHLGDDQPADSFYRLESGRHYGWPYCYVRGRSAQVDSKYNPGGKFDCTTVPAALADLGAHSAPLGLTYFDNSHTDPRLKDSFLVALHGSGNRRIGRGYEVVSVRPGTGTPTPLIRGFLQKGQVYGRPVAFHPMGPNRFLMSDDYGGVVYYIQKK